MALLLGLTAFPLAQCQNMIRKENTSPLFHKKVKADRAAAKTPRGTKTIHHNTLVKSDTQDWNENKMLHLQEYIYCGQKSAQYLFFFFILSLQVRASNSVYSLLFFNEQVFHFVSVLCNPSKQPSDLCKDHTFGVHTDPSQRQTYCRYKRHSSSTGIIEASIA